MSGFKAYNYTNTWKQEKKLYSLYEWQLPTPIAFNQILIFVGVAAVWIPLMLTLGIKPTGAFQIILWAIVPGLAAFFGNKPVWEDKSVISFFKSIIRFYLFESKYVLDGNPKTGTENGLILEDNIEELAKEDPKMQKKLEMKTMKVHYQHWSPDEEKLEYYNTKVEKVKPTKKTSVAPTKKNPPMKKNNKISRKRK